jgi:hypothetical protein
MLTTTTRRRGRQRRTESFSEWMARIDTQVEAAYRQVSSRLPVERLLSPAQRRIVEMLAEHLRSLPELGPGEDAYGKPEYHNVNVILTELFRAKYPHWTAKTSNGTHDVGALPKDGYPTFERLLRNCAGRAPEEIEETYDDDRD